MPVNSLDEGPLALHGLSEHTLTKTTVPSDVASVQISSLSNVGLSGLPS